MRQANTIKPARSQSEAREMLFAGRPDLRDLFNKIEALPADKQGPVIRTLTESFSGQISGEETEAKLSSIIRG